MRSKIEESAVTELNGKEIRNITSMAGHVSMCRKEKIGYEHLRLVIEEVRNFEYCLRYLNAGVSRDENKEAEGAR